MGVCKIFVFHFAPLGALLVILYFCGLWQIKNRALLVSISVFLLVHHLIGHKELRFLFPLLLYFAPVFVVMGWKLSFDSRQKYLLLEVFWLLTLLLSFFCLSVPQNQN